MPYRIKNEMGSTVLSFRTAEGSRMVIEPLETAVVNSITPGMEALRIRGRLSYTEIIEDEDCEEEFNTQTYLEQHESCGPGLPITETPTEISALKHDRIEVTVQHIADKRFSLSDLVTRNNTVIFLPEGGIPQFPSIDFITDGNKLSWEGLGLDGFIEADDIVHVYYS